MQKACIIIPCYNEEFRFPVREFNEFFNEHNHFDFCFVNDGSSDRTLDLLNGIRKDREERIRVVDCSDNGGKAEAVRQGMLHSLKDHNYLYFGYFDADMATPLNELNALLDAFDRSPEYIFVIGSRVKRMGARINRSTKRHYFGRMFSTIASLMLRLPVYDTQCGAKLLKRSVAEIVFEEPFISRWLFDIEIFARITAYKGYENILEHIYEVPLHCWVEKGGSAIKFSHLVKVPFELYRISRRYNLKLLSRIVQ